MKKQLLIPFLTLAALARVSGVAFFGYGGAPYSIPDGNPNGAWSSVIVSGLQPSLTDLSCTFNLSGGYNGDLYAYLSFNGRLVALLNRIGVSGSNPFGADGAGMNVTLSDGAAVNIHSAGNGYLAGTYRADGQNINPSSPPGSFNPNGGSITLDGTFAGLNPNGEWTLLFADMVSSGEASTLNSWSLNISAVPEPGYPAFGIVVGICWFLRRKWTVQPSCVTRQSLRLRRYDSTLRPNTLPSKRR